MVNVIRYYDKGAVKQAACAVGLAVELALVLAAATNLANAAVAPLSDLNVSSGKLNHTIPSPHSQKLHCETNVKPDAVDEMWDAGDEFL